MKILVLGTSNAVKADGYVPGLAAALPEARIDNRSIGASPGLQFFRFIGPELSAYDWVILDSAVNDENLIDHIGSLDWYAELMAALFCGLAACTRLMVLGLCNRRLFASPSPVFAQYRGIAEDSGAVFVSAPDFMRINGWAADAYDDEFHLRSEVAFAFGRHVGQAILNAASACVPDMRPADWESLEVTAPGYDALGALQVRSTSLGAFHTRVMFEGAELRFGRRVKVIGCLVDANATHCGVMFPGSDPVRGASLRLGPGAKTLMKFVPFRDGVACDGLRVVAPSADPLFEPYIHELRDHPPALTQLSLSSVLVRRFEPEL